MISAATASVSAATTATRSVRRTLLASSATAFLNNSSTHHPAYSSSATRTQSEGELKHGIEAGGSSSSTGERIKYFKVYRWDPEIENQKPYLSTYPVDLDDCGPMVRFFFPRWPFPHCGRHGPFVLLPSFWLVYLLNSIRHLFLTPFFLSSVPIPFWLLLLLLLLPHYTNRSWMRY